MASTTKNTSKAIWEQYNKPGEYVNRDSILNHYHTFQQPVVESTNGFLSTLSTITPIEANKTYQLQADGFFNLFIIGTHDAITTKTSTTNRYKLSTLSLVINASQNTDLMTAFGITDAQEQYYWYNGYTFMIPLAKGLKIKYTYTGNYCTHWIFNGRFLGPALLV